MMSAGALAIVVAVYLTLAFLLAALSYRYIEFPRTSEWRRLFLLDPRRRAAEEASP